jgi:hypothetical protein
MNARLYVPPDDSLLPEREIWYVKPGNNAGCLLPVISNVNARPGVRRIDVPKSLLRGVDVADLPVDQPRDRAAEGILAIRWIRLAADLFLERDFVGVML